jgi:hypothetical protein
MMLKQRIGTPSLIVCLDRSATSIILNAPIFGATHPFLQRLRQLRLNVDHHLAAGAGRR